MRLETLRGRAIGPFRDEFSVDLRELPTIIAVTGPNGAGKSTLLELFMGALDRELPTRGPLGKIATARDSMIEARVVNGVPYTIRQLVDCVSGKGEAVVLDADGAPLVESAKLRDFDVWRAAHLPPREVLLASIFAAQGAGGFLTMKPGDRKGVLLRVLGIERLEQLAERARARAATARTEVDGHERALVELRTAGGDIAEAEGRVTRTRQDATLLDGNVSLDRAALELAETEARIAQEKQREAAAAMARLEQLGSAISAASRRIRDLGERIRNNLAVIDRGDEIRAAVARVAETEAEMARLDREADAAQASATSARLAHDAFRAQMGAASKRHDAAYARALRHRNFLDEWRPRIAAAQDKLGGLRAAAEGAAAASVAAEQRLSAHVDAVSASAAGRLSGLRAALGAVVEAASLEQATTFAREGLARDDSAETLRTGYEDINRARYQARDAADAARRALEAAEADAEVAVDSAERDFVEAEAEREAAALEVKRLASEAASAKGDAETQGQAAAETRRQLAELDSGLAATRDTARLAGALANAEVRLAELQPQMDTADRERDAAEAELAGVVVFDAPPVQDVQPFRTRLAESERSARAAATALAAAEQRLEQVRTTAARISEVESALGTARDELTDWARLGEDLGRDGVQALEIDAAGPEITELTNDLLHQAFGPRFTVRLDTTRPKADGKGQIEVFDVTVIDTLRGREARAETLSGGERVIVSEALSLALTMVACRRAGVTGPTLVRDESGAALDPENARAYVAMLRRAADLVGASHVLFVSHSPEVQELADARLHVEDGRVEVRR